MARELRESVFWGPGPAGLFRVWQFAGPACCSKAVGLARNAGPMVRKSPADESSPLEDGPFRQPELLPWRDWWPALAGCNLMAELREPANGERHLSLDRAWAA